MSDPLPLEFARALADSRRRAPFGQPIHYFTEVDSTNDVAAALAEAGAPEGTTVVAACQTAGRGRLGRHWHSPPEAGLYATVVCRSAVAAPFLTLAGGVAIADGIRSATGLPVEIKWPNDVVVGAPPPARRRKIAGVLAEAASHDGDFQYIVLGFGVNVRAAAYPATIAGTATALEVELGRSVDQGQLLAAILEALATHVGALAGGRAAELLRRWRELAPSASGAPVECDTGAGRCGGITAGVADDGALLVRVGDRIERVVAGEVVWK